MIHFTDTRYDLVRSAVRSICRDYTEPYWREIEASHSYPTAFIQTLTNAGFLSAMIPEEYGGSGGGVAVASVVLEEVNRLGGNAGSIHGQMYNLMTLVKHANEQQRTWYLPRLADGRLRLQSMGVTEAEAGSDTLSISTRAVRQGGVYSVNGRKMWTSRIHQTDDMILLVRTTPPTPDKPRTPVGLSLLLVNIEDAKSRGLSIHPIPNSVGHDTSELVFENVEVPVENLIGEEGQGFYYLLDGLNAERTLIAAECIGDAYWFLDKAANYAKERIVFGQPIGIHQGIQFPLAEAYSDTLAADALRWQAIESLDKLLSGRIAKQDPQHLKGLGLEANIAKYLSANASWKAGNACVQTFGGLAFAKELDIERKLRQTRLYQVAPISTNLILAYVAERALGLPKSY